MSFVPPGGQQTHHRQRTAPNTGWKFTFSAALCHACPLRQRCLAHPAGVAGRTVIKNTYAAEYTAARAHSQIPVAAQMRRQQRAIERKLAEIVRWQGGRRLRYRGRGRIQHLLTGMVVNVTRMVRLLFAVPTGCPGPAAVPQEAPWASAVPVLIRCARALVSRPCIRCRSLAPPHVLSSC